MRDFQRNQRSSLISIKANPYHYKDKAVIIGDAAHSMVPFYGQGLNCGLEDVRILQTILLTRGIGGQRPVEKLREYAGRVSADDSSDSGVDAPLQAALEEYSTTRHGDLVAICDLAMNNYTEMRHDVTTPIFKILKSVDNVLASLTIAHAPPPLSTLSRVPYPSDPPKGWIPLYTMVTFRPDVSYALARRRAAWQARCLRIAGWTAAAIGASAMAVAFVAWAGAWKAWAGSRWWMGPG